jgi:hypothetical protein
MQSQPSHKQYVAGVASTDSSILLDAPMIDWRDRSAALVRDELAYMFYALLDDAELREVFGDFVVPARTELGH